MTDSDDKQLKVLVVDDEPSIRLLVSRALQRNGFETDVASDGVEALEKLEQDRFDLLILDVMMPRLNGIDVIEQLSGNAERPPKILVMTAASPSVLRDLPAHRVEKIITKPFELQTLISSAIAAASAEPAEPEDAETLNAGSRTPT